MPACSSWLLKRAQCRHLYACSRSLPCPTLCQSACGRPPPAQLLPAPTQPRLPPRSPQVFAHAVPDPVNNPPVANINMDPGGRFAFVEFQKEELASKALEMDRVVRAGRGVEAALVLWWLWFRCCCLEEQAVQRWARSMHAQQTTAGQH